MISINKVVEGSMQRLKLFLIVILLVIVGAACGAQNESSTTDSLENPSITASVPTPTATLSPANTPLSGEAIGDPDGLPPISFVEVYEAGVEAGNWTKEEGLVLMMKYMIGQIGPEEVPGVSEVEEAEGTGIVRMVIDYLDQPDHDSEIGQELNRLKRILFPPQEVLEQISRQKGSVPRNRLVSVEQIPPLQTQEACAELAEVGYDGNELENADEFDENPLAQFFEDCYIYVERILGDQTIRVYYPAGWEGDDARESRVRVTLEALADSSNVYRGLPGLTVKDLNAAFGLAPYGEAKAFANFFDPETEACPIAMLPLSDQFEDGKFKQIVAHEVFHCVQTWSFPNSKPYDTHKWWMEGSAEYFSNLVYPSTNLEYRKIEYLDTRSAELSLFQMTYENFGFFQFMGNKYSTENLIGILYSISSSNSHSGQETALRAVADFEKRFNLYVVEFLSSGILDSDQSTRIKTTTLPKVSGSETIEDKNDDPKFRVQPFVAMRYRVTYKEEKRFLQTALTPDDAQFSSVEEKTHQDISSWSDLPPEIRSECDKDVIYLFAITSVDDFYVDYEIDITLDEKAECDPCLLGTWDVDHQSFETYIEGIMARNPSGGTIDLSVGGHQYLQFKTDGKVLSQRKDFTLRINEQFSTIINGNGSGTYTANGEVLTVMNFLDITDSVGFDYGNGQITYTNNSNQASFSIFGMDYSDPNLATDLNAGNAPQTQSAQYVCDKDDLTITIPNLGELLFNRVDQILPTPVPTAAPADNE